MAKKTVKKKSKSASKTPKPKKTAKKTVAKPVETTKLVHVLVPEHTKLSDKEKQTLFETYNITIKELPKILITDPAIRHLEPKENDVIKISRKSPTAGNSVFYRGVINE